MEIKVRFLDNLRMEASFDEFKVVTDQPVRYKGDGQAPSPFDYFLASSALCAGYFVKLYCKARKLPTEGIEISQNNIIDPEDRYNQTFKLSAKIPESFSVKHKEGIIAAMDRCTVKKVIQSGPKFDLETFHLQAEDSLATGDLIKDPDAKTVITGKDSPPQESAARMTEALAKIGIRIEIASWRNIVENIWSVHVRDIDSPSCFSNGKGTDKLSALCSALGEFLERLSCNYFYNDYFLGEGFEDESFVHYPDEKWFKSNTEKLHPELLDQYCQRIYNPDGELKEEHLLDGCSGITSRGVCAIPFVRQSDQKTVYFPVNLIGNLFVSNGMSAGNSVHEARVQALSEIFERAVKKEIIENQITLPTVPEEHLEKFPKIKAGIKDLQSKGYPIVVKDASLGGRFPVMCVALLNPQTGGVYCSFGAHPIFEVALERSLTELMQGRSFEGLNDVLKPTFNEFAIKEPNNLVEHFVDSNGVVSWKFFSEGEDYSFHAWNFSGTTEQEFQYLMGILSSLEKQVYIADYDDLGTCACRILVPDYSEIYPREDLIWDNTNRALAFRQDILELHGLPQKSLEELVERLEEYGADEYMLISTLIGIDFDDNTVWGKLSVGELKLLIYLALGKLDLAQEKVGEFLAFNDNSKERRLFYQAMEAVIHITLTGDLDLNDYRKPLSDMYGADVMDTVFWSVTGKYRFYGLTKTSLSLEGLDTHRRLVDSYKKIHAARKNKIFQKS